MSKGDCGGFVGQNKNLATTNSISIIIFALMKHGKAKIKACVRFTLGASCVLLAKQKMNTKKHVVEMPKAHDILESLHTHMENLLEISRLENY
jgi:hypothetical protein